MSVLVNQLENVLPKGMVMPTELKLLYHWIEDNGFYCDREDNKRVGSLYANDKLLESTTEREGGTKIVFLANDPQDLKTEFGEKNMEQLCVFAKSGADGSTCALWKTNEGDVKVVHMGSGSGSVLVCVLADNMVDFLRLIAIGYDEICWDELFPFPPNANLEEDEYFVKPNLAFQKWVKETFKVEIPNTASEIVKHPASMDDETSEDEFFKWYIKHYIS